MQYVRTGLEKMKKVTKNNLVYPEDQENHVPDNILSIPESYQSC